MSEPRPPEFPRRRQGGGAIALVATGAVMLVFALLLPAGAETRDPLDNAGPTGEVATESPGAAATVGPGTTVNVANTPYASEGMTCDESRDGWHFIMNGIETAGGGDPTPADFGPITLQFSDGGSGSATFTDTSSKTAHFLDATNGQSGFLTLISASMTFPAGTSVTSYNNFVISHPPCGTVTTSTNPVSTETSSTTSPVSTETSSTTSPVSTETTSTTSPVSTETTPTTGPDRDGALLIVGGDGVPVVTQAVTIAPSGSTLPSTGLDGGPFVVAGLVLITSGGALWIKARRRAAA